MEVKMVDQTKLTTVQKLYVGVQLINPLLRSITLRVEADLHGTGISVGQRAILDVLLTKKKATAPEITRILQLKRQFVGRELKELIQNEMVQSEPNPEHKRAHFHSLTKKSEAVIREIRAREMEEFTAFANRFTPEEIDAFYRIQKTLNEEMMPS